MKYAKAVLAAVFGLSPAAVVGVLALFKVHVDEGTVTWLLGVLSPVLGVLGVAVGPKNKEPVPSAQEDAQTLAASAQELQAQWYGQHPTPNDVPEHPESGAPLS